MATEKRNLNQQGFVESLRKELADRKASSPIISTRWYVADYTPEHKAPWHDEFNDYIDAKSVIASPYFETEGGAKVWVEQHDPDPGAELIIHKDNLRKFTEHRWVNW